MKKASPELTSNEPEEHGDRDNGGEPQVEEYVPTGGVVVPVPVPQSSPLAAHPVLRPEAEREEDEEKEDTARVAGTLPPDEQLHLVV